jgi:thiamine pyrophosphate-dependent acetolactate synthase large subunit-like protein
MHAGACAVVCAPTSSGKTFISSYVIQQVLRPAESAAAAAAAAVGRCSGTPAANSSSSKHKTSKKQQQQQQQQQGVEAAAGIASPAVLGAAGRPGVVVIVLPTKALVNQLAAQVGPT